MKYAWISKHKKVWPVTLACEVLEVSASGYFEPWRRKDTTKPSKPGVSKRISDEALLVHIKAIHAEVKQEYGWPKMWKELVRRHPQPGLIFHSDRGSQYCSHEFQNELKRFEMKSSMSRKGNCWDNAPTESLWGRLKVGRLYGRRFATRRQAMDEVIDWLNFYNHKRLHSTLDYVSPMTFEQRWSAAQQQDRKSA